MSQGCRSSIFSLFYCPHFGIFGTVIDDCIFTMKWLCSNYHHHYSRGVSIHFPNVNMIKINSKHSDHVNQNICKMANIINRNNNGKQWHRGWETSDLNCLSFWLLSSSSFQFKKILFFLISLIPISIPKAKHFVLMNIFFIYKTTIEESTKNPWKKYIKGKSGAWSRNLIGLLFNVVWIFFFSWLRRYQQRISYIQLWYNTFHKISDFRIHYRLNIYQTQKFVNQRYYFDTNTHSKHH